MSEYVLARIQVIQQELEELRKAVAHQMADSGCATRLKGLWKGIQITEEDLEEAQWAVFKNAYKFEE